MPTGRCPVRRRVQKSWPERSRRERPAVGRAMQLALAVADRRADGEELGHVLTPLVAADLEADADDPVRAELVGLFLHAGHGELTGGVHRLREHGHLLADLPRGLLEADVVDRRADDEPERVEARLLDEQELGHGEVGGEEPALVLLQPAAPRLWHAFQGGRVVAAHRRRITCGSRDGAPRTARSPCRGGGRPRSGPRGGALAGRSCGSPRRDRRSRRSARPRRGRGLRSGPGECLLAGGIDALGEVDQLLVGLEALPAQVACRVRRPATM